MNEKLKTKLEWALYYQSIGLSIIPTGLNKVSLVKWEPYQDRFATVEEIKRWWSIWPDANPTLIAGRGSGVVALDLDKKHNRTSKEFSIPPTICAKSGSGGEHFFFKHPGRHIPSTNGQLFGEGVDIKADGGYILLAPSVNENGGVYEWTVPLESKDDLAEMPEWLLKAIQGSGKERSKLWQKDPNQVLEGSRNETATSMAGKIRSSLPSALLETVGWSGLNAWNKAIPKPLPERELRTVWESVSKYPVVNNKIQKNISGKAIVKCFADIKSVPISWLWPGRIAIGKLTMIAGDPGLGKSLVTATLATHVSKGYPWPVDETKPLIGDVIFISAEDDPADTIKPRLEAAGADCNRIHIVEAIRETVTEGESTQHMFSFKRDIAALADLLSNLPNCSLVIIDPVSAYLDSADSNNNSDIRGLLAPLSELASKHKVAIVLVSHLNKNTGGNASYRVMGSLAFTAAVRTAYIVTKDNENPDRRLLMPLKSNISKDKTGLAYSIVEANNNAPVIAWESEPVDITAEEALDMSESTEEHTAIDEAVDFLLQLLTNGPIKAKDTIILARQNGISNKTLRSAREKLKIKSKKSSSFEDGYWQWELPEDALKAEDAQSKIRGALEQARHLGDTPKTRLDSFVDSLDLEAKEDKKVVDNTPPKLPEQPPEQKDLPF